MNNKKKKWIIGRLAKFIDYIRVRYKVKPANLNNREEVSYFNREGIKGKNVLMRINQCETMEKLNALRLEGVKDGTYWKNRRLFTNQVYRILYKTSGIVHPVIQKVVLEIPEQ